MTSTFMVLTVHKLSTELIRLNRREKQTMTARHQTSGGATKKPIHTNTEAPHTQEHRPGSKLPNSREGKQCVAFFFFFFKLYLASFTITTVLKKKIHIEEHSIYQWRGKKKVNNNNK